MNGFDDFDTQVQCDEFHTNEINDQQDDYQEDYWLDSWYESRFEGWGDS